MVFDYGVIGGGPAGYTVAMMFAKAGKKVVLFEQDKLGGTCLNKGCIPTKSILHSSEIYREVVKTAPELGLDIELKSFDFKKVVDKKNKAVEKIRKALELAVKNSGVNIVYKKANVKDKSTVVAGDEEYKVNEIIVATGAKPKEIRGLEFDSEFILSSDDVLNLNSLPKSVLIVGSGAIGIEWARIFSNFGVEVSVVEMAEHLIPLADIDVSKRIERIFKQRKIKFYLNDCVSNIQNRSVELRSGAVINPDFVLVAIGRVPLKTDLDLVSIGDACGEIQLAHYAMHQAKSLACGIDFDKKLTPSVIYGEPEIAWVGIREQDCDEDCKSVTLPITALGKSWCDDSIDGFIKFIIKDEYIVGAHIVSKEASALIHEVLIAIQNRITVDELKKTCFAHPTYSEGIFDLLMSVVQ